MQSAWSCVQTYLVCAGGVQPLIATHRMNFDNQTGLCDQLCRFWVGRINVTRAGGLQEYRGT